MASYDAIINLKLKGLNQLKEVERAVNGITGKTKTGRARTGASSIVKKELSAEQERLKTLGQIIKLKRTETALNRQITNQEAFIAKQNKKRVGPNNLLGLPSSKDLEGRAIQRLGNRGFIKGSQSTSKITDFTASSVQKAEFFEKRRNEAIAKGIANNNKLIGSERVRNAQLIKTNTAVQKAGENLIRLSDSFGKLSVSAGNLLPQTRTSSGKMLALPSSEMLDQRVRGSGQLGGFSRALRGKSFRQRIGATRGFDMQSALISGAFPLLFGQGPIGAAAGALGGGIGGMFGQMGGFAGGIAATALVQQIQTAITAISDLGKALGPFTQNTEAVVSSLGLQNTVQEAQIRLIEQVEGKTAAFNAAMKLMANDIGQRGVDALKQFGESSRILSSQFTLAITKLQAFAAGVANFVLRITGLEGRLKKADAGRVVGAAAVRGNSQALGLMQRQKQIDEMDTRGGEGKRKEALQAQLDIEKQIFAIREQQKTKLAEITLEYDQAVQKNKEELQLKEAVKKLTETGMSQAIAKEVAQREQLRDKVLEEVDALADALRIERAKLGNTDTELERLKEIDAVLADILKKRQEINGETEKAVGKIKSTGDEIKKVKVTKEEIADLLANEMTNALMGLIEGTKSLGESLASIAKSLAKMFLNAAFQNIFNRMFQISEQGSYNRAGGFKAFQYGGVVNSPTMGIIGEGGESEYVIPASKMDGAMARYSAGARGGAVIPGGSHESGTVAGGTGNAIVEYTGPVLNFNGDEYVPKSAVPDIIGAASKQGAMAGKAQTFNALKNSRSQRASLGL